MAIQKIRSIDDFKLSFFLFIIILLVVLVHAK